MHPDPTIQKLIEFAESTDPSVLHTLVAQSEQYAINYPRPLAQLVLVVNNKTGTAG